MTSIEPAERHPAAALHQAFVQSFADYLAGPFQLSLAQWPQLLARHAVDLARSRVAVDAQGAIVAFANCAPRQGRRGPRWRLAAMGALPAARGQGAAPALLRDFLARAMAAGQTAVELEVFAQNERAARLYQGHGFVARHALFGFERAAEQSAAQAAPYQDLGLAAALQWLDAQEPPGLPLQMSARSLGAWAAHGGPCVCWQQGQAQLVWTLAGERVQILSLLDLDPDQADAEALVRALCRAQPQRALFVPPLLRDDLGGQALRRLGFAAQPLHQLLMERELAPLN